ncbi:MAG: nucleotide sugar dehydrogenase, partial [Microgenomates group bacterium]
MRNAQTVSVLGLGYIGLPTALLLANAGVKVRGFDIDSTKIEKLEKGELYFDEKGLPQLFKLVRGKKLFTASNQLHESDCYIIAVPTPQKKGTADLKYVLKALATIEQVFKPGSLIIIESTVAPRDCADALIPIISKWNKAFLFSHCPERAIPGNTLHEMQHNDRIIGGVDKKSNDATIKLYSKFVTGELFRTDPTTAAACKVMENTYRAVNIALANEFSQIAQNLKFNVWEAIELANKHPRVNIHSPGPGVGGHCIPIDPWFFIDPTKKSNSLIEKSLEINSEMAKIVVTNVTELLKKHSILKPKIGLLGYSYKKNVDDTRETPTKKLYELLSQKYQVQISDEYVRNQEFTDLETILKNSNVIILSTD